MNWLKGSTSQKSKQVCIIILTHNNVLDTIECLDSINCLDGGPYSVLVVDNASTDDTVNIIKERFPIVDLLPLSKNIGFSAGVNEGISWGWKRNFDYFVVLNNDTIVDTGMIQALLDVAYETNDSAMIMPKVYYYSPNNGEGRSSIWSDGGYLRKFPPSIKLKDDRRSINFDIPRKIEFAPFCGIMIPKKVVESVGLLDTSFFFFYEDWDYCKRVYAKGLSIWCAPKAVMWHKVSRTIKNSNNKYWLFMGDSAIKFYKRHFSIIITIAHISFLIFRDFIIKFRNIKYLFFYIKGILSGLFQPLDNIVYLD